MIISSSPQRLARATRLGLHLFDLSQITLWCSRDAWIFLITLHDDVEISIFIFVILLIQLVIIHLFLSKSPATYHLILLVPRQRGKPYASGLGTVLSIFCRLTIEQLAIIFRLIHFSSLAGWPHSSFGSIVFVKLLDAWFSELEWYVWLEYEGRKVGEHCPEASTSREEDVPYLWFDDSLVLVAWLFEWNGQKVRIRAVSTQCAISWCDLEFLEWSIGGIIPTNLAQ